MAMHQNTTYSMFNTDKLSEGYRAEIGTGSNVCPPASASSTVVISDGH